MFGSTQIVDALQVIKTINFAKNHLGYDARPTWKSKGECYPGNRALYNKA